MNAKNVEVNAPVKFINKLKNGIDAANIPLVKTMKLLNIIFFKKGYYLTGESNLLKSFDYSDISIAGII
jgi:hypothetical protein